MTVEEIFRMLDNPATLGDALIEAAKLPFSGDHKILFQQKRQKYIAGLTDYERPIWVGEMKNLLLLHESVFESKSSPHDKKPGTVDRLHRSSASESDVFVRYAVAVVVTLILAFFAYRYIESKESSSAATAQLKRVSAVLPATNVQKKKASPLVPAATAVTVQQKSASPTAPENFVLIRGGKFSMGSPVSEYDRESDETLHQVRVSNFYICKYAVTVAEFGRFVEDSSYRSDAEKGDGSLIWDGTNWQKRAGINWRHGVSGSVRPQSEENHPVLHVSWNDAVAYCKWMTKKTGQTFRLPTEAEWEYACRAGTTTPFNTGENLTTGQANYDGNYPYKNNQKGVYRENTVAVESFSPNAWGLYNMHGNVYEWCGDWYGDKYYDECKAKGVVENPKGPETGSSRVLRGGCWFSNAGDCRSADRGRDTPDTRGGNVGFRLVLVP